MGPLVRLGWLPLLDDCRGHLKVVLGQETRRWRCVVWNWLAWSHWLLFSCGNVTGWQSGFLLVLCWRGEEGERPLVCVIVLLYRP